MARYTQKCPMEYQLANTIEVLCPFIDEVEGYPDWREGKEFDYRVKTSYIYKDNFEMG